MILNPLTFPKTAAVVQFSSSGQCKFLILFAAIYTSAHADMHGMFVLMFGKLVQCSFLIGPYRSYIRDKSFSGRD